ncbi:MAG: signal peptidase I [Elusimicrobia bacterium]|nr:signal peptidase I [Elusimicrobiota bacterium]
MILRRLVFLFGVAAAVALFLRAFAFEGIYVATASMEPTLPVGAHLFLDKVTYRWRAPRRGEIIVFKAPVAPHREMIKRVIAVGGDTVEIRDKKVFLKEEALEEPYVQYTRSQERLRGDNLGPLTVPAEHLFVLGDNRDDSDDSSVWRDPETNAPVYFLPISLVRGKSRGFY